MIFIIIKETVKFGLKLFSCKKMYTNYNNIQKSFGRHRLVRFNQIPNNIKKSNNPKKWMTAKVRN